LDAARSEGAGTPRATLVESASFRAGDRREALLVAEEERRVIGSENSVERYASNVQKDPPKRVFSPARRELHDVRGAKVTDNKVNGSIVPQA
jgi:hypothetical protein